MPVNTSSIGRQHTSVLQAGFEAARANGWGVTQSNKMLTLGTVELTFFRREDPLIVDSVDTAGLPDLPDGETLTIATELVEKRTRVVYNGHIGPGFGLAVDTLVSLVPGNPDEVAVEPPKPIIWE